MALVTAVITLDGTAQQAFPTAPSFGVHGVRLEPLRGNGAGFNIGDSTVTVDGSGTGVIQQVAQPPAATVPVDFYEDESATGENTIHATELYVRGTNAQKILATFWTT